MTRLFQTFGRPHSAIHQRMGHVLEGRRSRQQLKILEDEADLAIANPRQPGFVEACHILAVEAIGARGGPVQASQDVQQRGLSRTGGADERDRLTAMDSQMDVIQRDDGLAAHLVGLADALQFQQRRAGSAHCRDSVPARSESPARR